MGARATKVVIIGSVGGVWWCVTMFLVLKFWGFADIGPLDRVVVKRSLDLHEREGVDRNLRSFWRRVEVRVSSSEIELSWALCIFVGLRSLWIQFCEMRSGFSRV